MGAKPPLRQSRQVRARLERILMEARSAAAWNAKDVRLYRTIVPQMVRGLQDDEAAQWNLDFASELEPLEAA